MRTCDHHQQGLAKVLANAFKIMTREHLLIIMMLCGKDLDAPKVTVVILLHVQPWFIRSLEKSSFDDIEVRICDIWKYSIAGTIIDYLELSILKQ